MKIVSNTALSSLLKSGSTLGLLLVVGAGVAPAHAAAPVVGAQPAVVAINAPEASSGPTISAPAVSALPTPFSFHAAPSSPSSPLKNITAQEDKVSDSIKGVVKQLGSTDSVNLDDLNTARQAVAKLDILIEIEKRLAELEKFHSDHSGQKSLAAAIPASALAPPMPPASLLASNPSPQEMPVFAAPPAISRSDVSRISGADGHYAAVIQGKNVRIGDSLSDGSSVIAISASSVETKSKDGTVRRFKVKGVDQVYGHSL